MKSMVLYIQGGNKMRCIYCGEEMMHTNHYPKLDVYDFQEDHYWCPNCESQCVDTDYYGQEWTEGKIKMEVEDNE